jgi:hypothetical protein
MTPMTAGILTAGGTGEILTTGAGITEEYSQDEWYSRFDSSYSLLKLLIQEVNELEEQAEHEA